MDPGDPVSDELPDGLVAEDVLLLKIHSTPCQPPTDQCLYEFLALSPHVDEVPHQVEFPLARQVPAHAVH